MTRQRPLWPRLVYDSRLDAARQAAADTAETEITEWIAARLAELATGGDSEDPAP